MANLEYFRQSIQNILTKHGSSKPKHEDVEKEFIFDSTHDHYQLMYVGWNGLSRVYQSVMHFDIKDGKIWIQQNMTDVDLAQELLYLGIEKEDIVLGLQPPYKRPYTGYGVSEFSNKILCINCPRIILTQNSSNSPEVYQGSGSITRKNETNLELELSYFDDNSWSSMLKHLELLGEKQGNTIVVGDKSAGIGKIVKETEYFSLSATDDQNREWISSKVLIKNSQFSGNEVTLTGKLFEIQHTADISSQEKARMCIYLSQNINIPCNTQMKTGEYVADFSACDYKFSIINCHENTIINIESIDKKLPNLIQTRVCEALQFITGDLVFWSSLEVHRESQISTRIRPLIKSNNPTRKRPPIRFEKLDTRKDVWKLYEKYLNYILKYNYKEVHPISGWIGRIIETRAESLASELLTLSVAVESLLKMDNLQEYFLEKNPNNIESQISLVKDCIKELELEDSFKNRLKGFLDNMNALSATDKLQKLVDKGLVDESLKKAWKKIRHKAAHGCNLKTSEIEKNINLCNQVTVLFYHLIFLIIDYKGQYTDYSEDGWIKKSFNSSNLDRKKPKNLS